MSNNSTNNTDDYNQEEIVKKEARGLGDTDFGEVQEISGEYIITQKGTVAKDRFYIPKNLVERFDSNTVYFKITKDEARQYKRD
jgi:hypothetical protein